MFERFEAGERALLVHAETGARDFDARSEFELLAKAAGASAIVSVVGRIRKPDPKTMLGSGKVSGIAELVKQAGIDLVIFNCPLSPTQERNIEKIMQCRVLDRAGLILDIFAQRAQSFEGKLQVELAQLKHLSTRLVRGWTHLERQKGGIGMRGPGESQLETDRRLLGERIKMLTRRLAKIEKQRDLRRSRRTKRDVPTAALVGYTNAGKSTLFNRLTKSTVFAADQLFATLDPTLRQLKLAPGGEIVLADTVGFVRDLPHELVAAFRATLEETRDADILLHVVDASDPEMNERIDSVNEVLTELGADGIPQLMVYNKIDRLQGGSSDSGGSDSRGSDSRGSDEPKQPQTDRNSAGEAQAIWLSAYSGAGCLQLEEALAERLSIDEVSGWLDLEPHEARLRARLFELGAIESETLDDEGHWHLHIRLSKPRYEQFVAHYPVDNRLQASNNALVDEYSVN